MSGRLRRELWSAWWRSLDGQHLLDEFRSRTLTDDERREVLDRIGKLGDVSPEVRARASEEIIGLGSRATPLLRQIVGQAQPRLAGPARQCLEAIERDTARPLPDAAPRLLALRRPEGPGALLAYLPFAESDASPPNSPSCSPSSAAPTARRTPFWSALCKTRWRPAAPPPPSRYARPGPRMKSLPCVSCSKMRMPPSA